MNILLMCGLHLVPGDICVVTTAETWAGDLPTFMQGHKYPSLLREASLTVFLHHL